MSRFTRLAAVAAAVTLVPGLLAQTQAPPIRMAASSFASVEVHINARPIGNRWYAEDAGLGGPARIAITYGQPHARGRAIVGGLIPNDTVWRFGANMASSLHTDVDLTIGQLVVPRGDYSLYLLHSGGAWQLIVNSRTGAWGTDRDPTKDVGRVTLAAKTLADNEESLTIYLVPDSAEPSSGYATLGGVLRVRWGTLDLSTHWTVKQ
jgi:DUF2911 family protein